MGAITLHEPAREIPVFGTFDVVVLGGGPAGIMAAAAAARAGASTLLIERYGFLGGMGTAAGVTNFCGLFANRFGSIDRVVHGVADDLLATDRRTGRPQGAAHHVRQASTARRSTPPPTRSPPTRCWRTTGVLTLFHALAAARR